MSRRSRSRRGELARLCAEMRQQNRSYREIAARIQDEHRVSTRMAFRMAHGWTQAQVAERWNAQWPDQEAPKTAKQISYWEAWPAPSGRAPSLDTLDKLAFLYQCSAGDLSDGQDYSHLDPATSSHAASSHAAACDESDEPSPTPAAVLPPGMATDAAHPAAPLLPEPAGILVPTHELLLPEQFTTQLAAQLGRLITVADGTLGPSAHQWDAAGQQLVDLFTTWARMMNRRAALHTLHALGWAATAAAAGLDAHSLTPDDQQRLAAAIQTPSRVDATVLEHLEQVLSHCVQLQNKGLGPQAVLSTVLAQRHQTADMLGECPPDLRPRLLSLYADQSRVAGWLSSDLNDFYGAAYYYEQARTAAHEAQDSVLSSRVLSHLSQLATWQQRPRVGIDHAVAAQNWAKHTDEPLLRAWAADVTAQAYAQDGQQKACLAELNDANSGFVAGTGKPSQVPCYDDEGLHAGIRAGCLLQLNRPTDAAQAAERSLTTLDRTYVRDVASTTVDLGLARLECGDLDHAAATLEQAADLVVQNRSLRLARKISSVRARMQPWQDSRAVTQLDQRLRAHRLV